MTARRPRPKPVVTPAPRSARRYWPWVVGIGLGFALALACGAAAFPARRAGKKNSSATALLPPGPPFGVGAMDPNRAGAHQMAVDQARVAPRSLNPPLFLPDTIDSSLPLPAANTPRLKSARRIAPLLAMASAPDGSFLTADVEGVLRCYGPSLELRGETRLDRLVYQMTLDAKRGRLYAATTSRSQMRLTVLGDREQVMGDLGVYEVSALLAGKGTPAESKPLHTVLLDSQVIGMHLSEDGAWLCYLADSLSHAHLGRLATESMQVEKHVVPPSGTSGPVSLGNGALVALSGGVLFRIDPPTWTVTRLAVVSGYLFTLCPAGRGKVWAMERRTGASFLLLVDVEENKVLARHAAPYVGRFHLCTAPGRVFLSTSAVFDGLVQAFDVRDGSLTASGAAGRDGERLMRGGLHLTGDGRHLVTGNGHVFHVPQAVR